MVYYHRQQQQQQQRKGDEEQQQLHLPEEDPVSASQIYIPLFFRDHIPSKRTNRRFLRPLFLFSAVCLCLLAALRLLLCFLDSCGAYEGQGELQQQRSDELPCSAVPFGSICCDRTSSFRTDVCIMKGDIRTRSSSSSIHLYSSAMKNETVVEKIRPYTRKWEANLMSTVDELDLVATTSPPEESTHHCDVTHNSTAVVFSTGGYTGNVYHEFNDGLLPLFITAGHLNKNVVFVVLEYHDWWFSKYADVLSQLSDQPIIDFSKDQRIHCFPEAVVGLRIHDELSVDPTKMGTNATILDFRKLLDRAYTPRIRFLEEEEAKIEVSTSPEEAPEPSLFERPRLLVVSRNGSRGIENERELVELCEEIGFSVKVLRPERTTEMANIYREMNGSDAMIGVHGAAMTHLLFLRPAAAFLQVIPLGTEWAADAYYGEPARKMGLKYIPYKILPKESSLYDDYPKDDPVLRDPSSVAARGWEVTKQVYLDRQRVRLDLNRLLKRLTRMYHYTVSRRNRMEEKWDWSWQLPPQAQQALKMRRGRR